MQVLMEPRSLYEQAGVWCTRCVAQVCGTQTRFTDLFWIHVFHVDVFLYVRVVYACAPYAHAHARLRDTQHIHMRMHTHIDTRKSTTLNAECTSHHAQRTT